MIELIAVVVVVVVVVELLLSDPELSDPHPVINTQDIISNYSA